MDPGNREIVEELVSGPVQAFSHELGGLEFYGVSRDFLEVMRICSAFSFGKSAELFAGRKVYLFLPDSHGKSSLANAMAFQTSAIGIKAYRFDGTEGESSKHLRTLQTERDILVIVDGVPESSQARSTLLERFNALQGTAILFARPEYSTDANLKSDVPRILLTHVDERYADKVAWMLGVTLESLRDETGIVPEELRLAFRALPAGIFATLCGVPLGARVSQIQILCDKIGQAIQLGVNLGGTPAISPEDLAAVFAEFHSSGSTQSSGGFRLWVEGESDSRLLKLVCRLAKIAHGVDLGEGLSIIPLGLGREGGTSKITEIVIGHRTERNRDVFLIDCDDPGQHAQRELEVLNQDVLLLDVKLACGQMADDAEIEDLISVGCLDRFYAEYSTLRPEREVIRYKPPMSRRLVINGADKELLIDWLEKNAELRELENIMFMLCEARSRFSLRNLPEMKNKQGWKKRLVEESDGYKRLGKRPAQWRL